MASRRRRRHRCDLLNELETLIENQRGEMTTRRDQSLWKQSNDKFRPVFKTKLTWELIRQHEQTVQWSKGVWFHHGTPKFAMFHWLTYQDRLATGDRMLSWNANINPSCVLCRDPLETRNHLFFECPYSTEVWSLLMRGLLQSNFTTQWVELMELVLDTTGGLLQTFLTRYALQATIYTLWRERNNRRHCATPIAAVPLAKQVDRQVRNRCSSFRLQGNYKQAEALSLWLATR